MCLFLCHFFNIPPSQREKKDAAVCFQTYNLSSCCAIISLIEEQLQRWEAETDMEAQHTNGNCATCVRWAEVLNPWEAVILV